MKTLLNFFKSKTTLERFVSLSEVDTSDLQILGKSFHATVWAFSSDIALKNYTKNEVLALKWANTINRLCMSHLAIANNLLAVERLYPVSLSSLSKETIDRFISVAEQQLEELWASGWAHCDLKRPDCVRTVWGQPLLPEEVLFNNIIFTKDGIRLIDFNMSLTEETVKDVEDDFNYKTKTDIKRNYISLYINKDKKNWQKFKAFVYNSL